jgi:phosphoglycolate phosphatase-like HAD superfamily hydrolase
MNSAPKKYITLNIESGTLYLREDKVKHLGRVDAVIFDCDGVLIDIRESYDRAIVKAASYIFENMTGCVMPENLVSDKTIFLFRRSGGFNNDWDIVYGIIMFLLCEMPRSAREELEKLMRLLICEKNLSKRLLIIREKISANKLDLGNFLKDSAANLENFTNLLDVKGASSVDKAILGLGKISRDFYNLLRAFLHGSGKIGESIIATVFEEIFCGPKLFRETYGAEPIFYSGQGMIENGKPIVNHDSLRRLSSILSGARFGIASGSRLKPARHILRDLLGWFDPRATVFLDDIEKAEDEYLERKLRVNLKKPNPFSLLKSASGLEPFNIALYIGDSMEDVIMVNEAIKDDPRFLSAGVYRYSGVNKDLIKEFIKYGCDFILPSVNDIPDVIESVRRGELEGS